MPSLTQRRRALGVVLITLLLAVGVVSHAAAVDYAYDDLNRLIRVEYEDGTVIEYSYDSAGNRLQRRVTAADTLPPVTTASPIGGAYNAPQSVTLACNDGTGSGCDRTYYTTDGTTPTTASSVYSFPIAVPVTTTLKFFSKDLAGDVRYLGSFITVAGASPQDTGTLPAGVEGTFKGG